MNKNKIPINFIRMSYCADKETVAPNSKWFPVVLRAFRDGKNNNNWIYENAQSHLADFRFIPLLHAMNENGVNDYGTHNGAEDMNFTRSGAERIVGITGPFEEDTWIVNEGGNDWIYVRAYISMVYARPLVERLNQRKMSVSVETDITKQTPNNDGTINFHAWVTHGITILGDKVNPAIPGASIMAASEQNQFNVDLNEIQNYYENFVAAAGCKKKRKCVDENGNEYWEEYDSEEEDSNNADVINSADKIDTNNHNERSKIRMNKTFMFNKWQPILGDYQIIAFSENADNIFVLDNKTGTYLGYAINEDGDGFNEKRLSPITAEVTCTFANNSTVNFELDNVLKHSVDLITAANVRAETEKARVDAALSEAETAKQILAAYEKERDTERIAICREAVEVLHTENSGINVPESEIVSDSDYTALLADIDAGNYNALYTADKKWNGKTACCAAYEALVGKAILAARANKATTFWSPNALFQNLNKNGNTQSSALDNFAQNWNLNN